MTTAVLGLTVAILIALNSLPEPENRQQSTLPAAVNKPTLTYVSTMKASVLFGGYPRRGGPFGDTWSLQGGCWTKLEIAGPPPRGGHGAAYDARRGRLVVFGGAGADGTPLGDTWEFDGSVWEQKLVEGPSARMLHRMAFDSDRGRVVLFGGTAGGRQGPHSDETWEWDGAAWAAHTQPGPSARGGVPAMTYDSGRRKVILYGGWGDDGPLQDLWEWDGEWTRIESPTCPASPVPPS